MKILGEKGLSWIVKIMLDVIFLGGLLTYISLPISAKWANEVYYSLSPIYYYMMLALLLFTGVFALGIVFGMRKIFKTLNRIDPFMMDNVKSLRRIGLYSLIIALAYVFKIFTMFTLLTVVISMVFTIAGLFSIVLSEVFKQAVQVKEENELTI